MKWPVLAALIALVPAPPRADEPATPPPAPPDEATPPTAEAMPPPVEVTPSLEVAAPPRKTPFDRGWVGLSLGGGSQSNGVSHYFVIGGGVGYYVLDGVELGL